MVIFQYTIIEEWPPLAWAAQCRPANPEINIYHGNQIEVQDEWFCEAIWDGDFEAGAFDDTDLVFGSGARIREDRVVFVSSGSTTDRLQSLTYQNDTWVSNSLLCLMAIANASFDPVNNQYNESLTSIVQGIDKYDREFEVSTGRVYLTYFNNLKWHGSELTELEKLNPQRDFGDFTKYHEFLKTSLQKLTANMVATGRLYKYQLLGTLSSGYDSTTNTVLARQFGLKEVISFAEARGGEADHGQKIADILGIKLTLIARDAWRSGSFAELPFIVADSKGEDVFYNAVEDMLRGRVLLTGYHGDKIWGKETYDLSPNIVRGDRSGLSLTEFRLWTGFIHFPLPFIGVRQIRDINTISKSSEMAPWDIPGDYSRPICRRIAEEAGIPRDLFGVSKKAASVLFNYSGDSLSPATREAFHSWLRKHADDWIAKGKTPPYGPSKMLERFWLPFKTVMKGVQILEKISPQPIQTKVHRLKYKLENYRRTMNLLRYIFPWAIERTKSRYSAIHKYKRQL